MSVIKSLTTGVNDAGNALNRIGNCRCSVTFATKYDSIWANQTLTSLTKASKVVAIFIYIYRVTTDHKKIKETRFNVKETKGKTYFKSHKKIKNDNRFQKKKKIFFFFLLLFREGPAERFLSKENKNKSVSRPVWKQDEIQDGVAQSPFRWENEMLSRKKALF